MVLLEYLSEIVNSLPDKSFTELKKSFTTTRKDKRKRILFILNQVRKYKKEEVKTLISILNNSIFDKKQIKNHQLRNAINGFIREVEDFIIHLEVMQNEQLRQQMILSYTDRKNLFTSYQRTIENGEKLLNASKERKLNKND